MIICDYNHNQANFTALRYLGTVINNFKALDVRTDTGALWENFVFAERKKMMDYSQTTVTQYFWRSTQQQEIDLVEETEKGLAAFEIKWNPKNKARFSATFIQRYADVSTAVITPQNMEEYLLPAI